MGVGPEDEGVLQTSVVACVLPVPAMVVDAVNMSLSSFVFDATIQALIP